MSQSALFFGDLSADLFVSSSDRRFCGVDRLEIDHELCTEGSGDAIEAHDRWGH